MLLAMAMVVGLLYAAAFYLLLARNTMRLILGLLLLGHAANLLIFAAGGLTRGQPPIVRVGEKASPVDTADPLPQALILTAIVISFAVLAFAAVLVKRAYDKTGEDELNGATKRETNAC